MNKNWEMKKLGEVCTLQRGFDLPKNSRTAGNFPLVSSSGIIDTHEIWKVKAPGVVTGRSGSIGNVFYIEDDFWPLNTVLYIKDFHKNDARFVYYLLTQLDLKKYSSGTGVPTLNRNNVHDEMISVPKSISEQQRIVSILDETFAAIDKAKENAEKNLQNSRELFESYLQSVFANPGEGWEEKKLGEISVVNMGQSPKGSSYNTTGDGVPLINGPVEFGGNDPFSKTLKTKFTTEPTKMCKRGDLILCVRGSTTGRMNIAGFDSCIGRGVASISSAEYQDWINQYINFNRDTIYKLGTGATFPNVSSSTLSNLLIPIPPKEQQRSIVAKLDSLSAETKRLEAIYQQKLAVLDELKKSVLQKAFNGELTGA